MVIQISDFKTLGGSAISFHLGHLGACLLICQLKIRLQLGLLLSTILSDPCSPWGQLLHILHGLNSFHRIAIAAHIRFKTLMLASKGKKHQCPPTCRHLPNFVLLHIPLEPPAQLNLICHQSRFTENRHQEVFLY